MVLTKHSSLTIVNKQDADVIPWYQSHPLWSNMMTKTFDKTYKYQLNVLDSLAKQYKIEQPFKIKLTSAP